MSPQTWERIDALRLENLPLAGLHTIRQRLSHLVRKTSSFAKQLVNHVGGIWLLVHHGNASLGL
jgi:hypothetical protein